MANSKTKTRTKKTLADLEMIKGAENLLIEKEKRYQSELRKARRPQVEKLTLLKETKKKPAPKVSSKKK
ncbi:MAG TPA: hypothetical protein PKD91_05090 [Bacteroidia bacterium]|nr:hypothetical protein [Bacteroidia bacterium]